MHDDHPHPLLSQVPLTLSPFLSLPTAIPLPYSYKTLPSTLPPSITQPNNTNQSNPPTGAPQANPPPQTTPAAYITSPTSNTAATPDAILTSCHALQAHLARLEQDARRTLGAWEEARRREELAEKRRVAPGWLDSGVHLLRPEVGGGGGGGGEDGEGGGKYGGGEGQGEGKSQVPPQLMDLDPQAERKREEGEELDRVFGGMKV